MSAANRINLEVFTPALIFDVLSGKDFHIADYLNLTLGTALVVLGSGVIAYGVSRASGIAWRTLVPPSMFKNSGNMGLPLAVLPPAVLNYVLAEHYRQESESVASIVIWGNLASLLTIPVTLACILA
jgi:predicted permease